MKFAAITLALVLAATVGSAAFAADPAPAKELTPQQQKMKDCNAQATGKTGDERKAFMKTCLKGNDGTAAATPAASAPAATPAKPMTQQEKMKACNVQAGEKHLAGAERKTFMSTCLKSDSTPTAAPATH